MKYGLILIAAIVGFLSTTAAGAEAIDFGGLLAQMLDRSRIAEFPEPAFVCKQASSYNRSSQQPGTPEWFSTDDYSHFVRCDKVGDRREWVMLDVAGLGRDAFGPAELQYFNSFNGVVWRNDPDHCDIAPSWLPSELPWWMLEIDKPFENWSVLARFNWRKLSLHWSRDRVAEREVRFSDLGLSDKKEYLVYEFWSRQFLGRKKHAFVAPLQTPGNGLQVFSIREAREHPWVISTSRHISQGGVDLMNLRWDANKHTLTGESAVVQKDPYQIAVYLPQRYGFLDTESSGADPEIEKNDEYMTATIVPKTTGTIGWSMTFAEQTSSR